MTRARTRINTPTWWHMNLCLSCLWYKHMLRIRSFGTRRDPRKHPNQLPDLLYEQIMVKRGETTKEELRPELRWRPNPKPDSPVSLCTLNCISSTQGLPTGCWRPQPLTLHLIPSLEAIYCLKATRLYMWYMCIELWIQTQIQCFKSLT